MHQRKPSITPTIGFAEYSNRHSWGTTCELNPTGDIYRPSCVTNGITYRTSLYLTFNAVIQSDGPMLAAKANTMKKGSNTICQAGMNLYQIIIPIRMENVIRKSANATTMLAIG